MTEPAQEHPKFREVGKKVAWIAAREHPTLVLTLFYLGLTFVGLIHDLWFYRYFNINILDFSESSDFLLAGIRNPAAVILSMLPIAILVLIGRLRETAIRKSKWYDNYQKKYLNTRWNSVGMRTFIYGWFVIVYAILFTQFYSAREASRIKKGIGRRITYIRNDGIRTDEQPILLGTTTKFLFFYHPSTKTTEIVPIDATTALRVDSRRRREREQDSLVFPDSLAIPDSGQ
jgi:hypothetical protein